MSRVQFLATASHYDDHIRPVWKALPPEHRASFHTKAATLEPGLPTVVASWGDYKATSRLGLPVIFFEHGAGFTYQTKHHSYAGGPGRDRVILFANVNRFVQEANAKRYPDVPQAIVGSPKLDALSTVPRPQHAPPIVAFSWHWDCKVAPETRAAFPHYQRHLRRIANQAAGKWIPAGHAHPVGWAMVRPSYKQWRWQIAREFTDVVQHAAVYVCDNSSTIYEWAALDRPAIILNAPWYRRDVQHGPLRFWERIPGIQVDEPQDLAAAIDQALTNDTWSARRQEITADVYPHVGHATQRAVDAILEVLTSPGTRTCL